LAHAEDDAIAVVTLNGKTLGKVDLGVNATRLAVSRLVDHDFFV
jgi:hypothetical protein